MPVLDLSSIAEDFNENPYPHYARLRAQGPVHRVKAADGQGAWLIVGHQEARQALTHPAVSKNWLTSGLYTDRERTEASANMMRADPPDHTRLRRLVSRSFAPGRIEGLRPRIQEIVDGLLDAMEELPGRRADLIEAFAQPLPMTVICELLGVPEADRGAFHGWITEMVSPTGVASENAAVRAMTAYTAELVDARIADPGQDLLSDWVTSRGDGGDRLSRRELVAMAVLMMVGGHETTVHLVSNGIRALLAHPGELAALRADPGGLIDGAVEEILRYDGPVETATFRFAGKDLEIGGTFIEAGSAILVCLAAADRDPARFERPDTFDIRRPGRGGHIAFGHGIHHCVAAPLGRLEGRIAIRSLVERFPDLREEPAVLEWAPGTLVRGTTRHPVSW
ncbi:cytochrome P450 family protein [Streptomyces sp. NBC_01264]|uniref:cytochrome P450 family protein n=1 Tax=Streptomyces sp. NBC_01264 TaxID=2903804 RepID=UPI002255CCBE|nr:cytochrome P450 [Streptomyces sp. NBC_01264]MCX4783015.1 cytochrome P450 [Streptomyces sp. NBC_01264]